MTRGPRAYYTDFVLLPLSIALVTATTFDFTWIWVLLALHGLVMFTLIEYWVHRLLLHKVLWSGYHQRHHSHADEYVVFPWWYMPLIFTTVSFVVPWGWFAGFQLGALWFFSWHHILHHWDLTPYGGRWFWISNKAVQVARSYARWHELHHKDLPFNYGITHPLWDLVFGTYCTTEDGRRILMARALLAQKQHRQGV